MTANARALLPNPALAAGWDGLWVAHDGQPAQPITRGAALRLVADTPVLMVNAPLVASRIGAAQISGLDLLELFAFVRPAQFAVPNARGLALALRHEPPLTLEDEPAALFALAESLLAECGAPDWRFAPGAYGAATALNRLKWPWGPLVAARVVAPAKLDKPLFQALPEWQEPAPRPAPRTVELAEVQVLDELARAVGANAEPRAGQRAYTRAVAAAFQPRAQVGQPTIVLAEAGTGTGKTLGYLAPARLWAEASGGTVWISTYTKALQRQLAQELRRLYPDPTRYAASVVVRKGRENYLCLLNLEDAVQGAFTGRAAILSHLVARWARFTKDGDMVGGDLPGWLTGLFGAGRMAALSDRRGECVYAGCPHFRRCFIESAIARTADAQIVVANHALVMMNAARGRAEGQGLTRLVFDEGHHLFEAADSTFAVRLSGGEALELRRWLLGPEGGRARGRRRGLETRLSELGMEDPVAAAALGAILKAAQALPSDQWLARLAEGAPYGVLEALFAAVRETVYARAEEADAGFGLDADLAAPPPRLIDAALAAAQAIDALVKPMRVLGKRIEALLEDQPAWLEPSLRSRLEGARLGLDFRQQMLVAWLALLARIGGAPDPDFVDWLALERVDSRELDVAICRHWLDPTRPLATTVFQPAHGVAITSATLRDPPAVQQPDQGWGQAQARVGARHVAARLQTAAAASPFDYDASARVLVVTDVKRGEVAQLAGAYRSLIEASGGGALGLFTAIARLKAVHARIAEPLSTRGLPLLAQHVDPLDAGTLVDLFRADRHASLLGTDALRDGVDVPGEALRLVILEGIPWSRPTLLHAARKAAASDVGYEDRATRARLAQAFGRLIRRAGDRGVFVLIGAATPSRLLDAFPVPAERVALADACRIVQRFLSHDLQTAPSLPRPASFPRAEDA